MARWRIGLFWGIFILVFIAGNSWAETAQNPKGDPLAFELSSLQAAPDESQKGRIVESYGKVPLYFITVQ